MSRFDARVLEPLLARHLAATGADASSVGHVVASLLQTSLRGVDSHGLQLFPHYVRAARAGRVNITPGITIEHTGGSTATLNADHAFGHRAGAEAIDLACDLALNTGAGAVCVRQSTHFGAAAYFGLRAAERGLVGFAFTNADALVKAFNARSAAFGTNPICFTAPLADEGPLCLDMATSLVSWNKVRLRRASGEALPPDWAFDAEGLPTQDPQSAASLNPAGAYKGYGLGMMIEILCGILADGPVGTEILPMFATPIEARRSLSHFFLALDVNRFISLDRFRRRLQGLVDSVRAMPASSDSVMVPGDPEKRAFVLRSVEGIPVSPTVLESFLEISADFQGAVRP